MSNVPLARPLRRAMMTAALLSATVLTACSQVPSESADVAESVSATPSTTSNAAAVGSEARDASTITAAGSSAAKGVAFTYRYGFRLPDAQVGEAQDGHVVACERLGLAHCRIANLYYRQQGDGPVEASTEFLLDPALARSFARDAIALVRQRNGEVLHSAVEGRRVSGTIDASRRTRADLNADLARVEAQLARGGLGSSERAELQAQAENLRMLVREARDTGTAAQAELATTPVTLAYAGHKGFAGFDSSRPFASALSISLSSLASFASFLLLVIGLTLPWLLPLAGIALAGRYGQRWWRARSQTTETNAPPTPA